MRKLSKKLVDLIEHTLAELQDASQEAADYQSEKSERWQDSDAGTNYAAWIEEIDAAVDALESLSTSPGEAG